MKYEYTSFSVLGFTFDARYLGLFQAEKALLAGVVRYHLDGESIIAVDPQRVLGILS